MARPLWGSEEGRNRGLFNQTTRGKNNKFTKQINWSHGKPGNPSSSCCILRNWTPKLMTLSDCQNFPEGAKWERKLQFFPIYSSAKSEWSFMGQRPSSNLRGVPHAKGLLQMMEVWTSHRKGLQECATYLSCYSQGPQLEPSRIESWVPLPLALAMEQCGPDHHY